MSGTVRTYKETVPGVARATWGAVDEIDGLRVRYFPTEDAALAELLVCMGLPDSAKGPVEMVSENGTCYRVSYRESTNTAKDIWDVDLDNDNRLDALRGL